MRVALIFDRHRPDTTGVYVERALRGEGVQADHWWLRDIGQAPAGYDLYLRIDHGDDYLAPWPRALRPAVFFVSDTHLAYNWPKVRRAAASYDLVCYAQRGAAERLGGIWLPFAWDAGSQANGAAEPAQHDVAFIGTEGGMPRKFILQALRERYARSRIGHADHRDLPAIYGAARIGFNYSIGAEVNMRIFEVLGAGALLVTNPVQGDDLARLGLRAGEHYAVYPRVRDVFGVIDRWLADDDGRRRVAAAGAAVVRARHTYAHRVRQLLALCADRLGTPQPASLVGAA